jgi:DNA-binding NtrC family response regulator
MKGGECRVLILDPDPVFRRKLGLILSDEGLAVETATGIADAVEKLKNIDFGCVIADEDLPEMKGHDAVPVLRAVSSDTPIIITVGQNTLEIETRVRREDVFFYHVKSFDVHELTVAVRDACRKTRNGACRAVRLR